jgi:hypothetical protein
MYWYNIANKMGLQKHGLVGILLGLEGRYCLHLQSIIPEDSNIHSNSRESNNSMLKLVLGKWIVRMWSEFSWLGIIPNDGFW